MIVRNLYPVDKPNVVDATVNAGDGKVVICWQGSRGGNRPDTLMTRALALKLIIELVRALAAR